MSNMSSLEPVSAGDHINAGRFFFAQIEKNRSPTLDSYAVVMVVTSDLLPQKLAGKTDLQRADIHPCWVMGRRRL